MESRRLRSEGETMLDLRKRKYTIEEYLELLAKSEERLEYFDGEVISITAAKVAHSDISSNLLYSLMDQLEQSDYEVFGGSLVIKTPSLPPFRFPDLSIVCGEAVVEEMPHHDVLLNPVLIGEVMSPASAGYDQGEKFSAYQEIESFREYLLADQERPHVIQYVRQPNNKWLRTDVVGLESAVLLESVEVTLPLSDIYRYRRARFSPAERPGMRREAVMMIES